MSLSHQSIPEKWAQVYAPKDLKEPTLAEKVLGKAVEHFSARQVKHEAPQDLKRKERVLLDLNKICNAWVRQCAVDAGVGTEVNGRPVEGRLETSGSWRLAIHEKDADIDLVCIAPQFCNLELFFGSFAETLKAHKDVTNFLSIPGAFVPIMTFDFRKVNIDLLLAVLPDVKTVPPSLDILDDGLLGGLDDKSRRSINGPRDTLTAIKLIRSAGNRVLDPTDADERYGCFLRTVRVLRLWAKQRCLYSNKMGYLGGINFNIMLAMVIQFYPRKSPGCLLTKFFEVFALWEKKPPQSDSDRHGNVYWRHPVRLCAELRGVSQFLDDEVYPKTSFGTNWGNMPVVTPSYPAYNSTGNVNPWTLRVMNEELERAKDITKECERLSVELVDAAAASTTTAEEAVSSAVEAGSSRFTALLDKLVLPSDFFWRVDHVHFLAVHVTCEGGFYSGQDDDKEGGGGEGGQREEEAGGGGRGKLVGVNPAFASFKRLCEPMFRNLISAKGYKNLGEYGSITRIHLLPKVFEGLPLDAATASPAAAAAAAASSTEAKAAESSSSSTGNEGGAKEVVDEVDPVAAGNASLTMWVAFVQSKQPTGVPTGAQKERLELGNLVEAFQTQVRERFERDPDGVGQSEHMCIRPRLFKQEQLPPWVFDLGDIGKERAAELRSQQKKEIKRKKKQELQQREQLKERREEEQGALSATAAAAEAEHCGVASPTDGKLSLLKGGDDDDLDSSRAAALLATALVGGKDGGGGAEGGEAARQLRRQQTKMLKEATAAASAKPLWVAVAEAHMALPTLAEVGDRAVRVPSGGFVQGFSRGGGACGERGEGGGDSISEGATKRVRGGGESDARTVMLPNKRGRRWGVVFLPDEEEKEWGEVEES